MADTVASSSTAASSNEFYHVFINHRGPDVKKTFASHLYHRLCSARIGLRVFLDQPELRAGRNFDCQIKDAIRTATVHVAIFSPRYSESEWCLNELLYMLESRALIIPVFYHVDPAVVRWPQGKGVYAEALRILENKKTQDPQTHEERPRHDPATIKKWREALSTASIISGFDLNSAPFNGDEGALVEKIVKRVLEDIKSELEFYCSPLYGGSGGDGWTEGPYSGITRIIMTANEYSLTSVQLQYVQEGKVYRPGRSHGGLVGPPHRGALGDRIEYSLNYPEEILTKISGHFGSYKPWPECWVVIKSLTFHTNKGKYGPFGQEDGTPFETEEGGKIVGFLGSSGTLVDSIGVYMLKPITWKDEASENGERKMKQVKMEKAKTEKMKQSENGESKDGVFMPKPITSKEEASENRESKDGVYTPKPITSKDEASENGENKDDQIMPPVISPNWIWTKLAQLCRIWTKVAQFFRISPNWIWTKAPQISGIWTKVAQLCRIWTKVGQLFRIWTKVAQFFS